MSAADAVISMEVVTADASGEQIRHLLIGILATRRHPCIPDQLARSASIPTSTAKVSRNQLLSHESSTRFGRHGSKTFEEQ